MKNILLSLILVLLSSALFAHGSHGPINDKKAVSLSLMMVDQLTQQDVGLGFGKLDASWGGLSRRNAKITKQDDDYFIVSVANKSGDKTLYVLVSRGGDIYDVNFTGKFEGLD